MKASLDQKIKIEMDLEQTKNLREDLRQIIQDQREMSESLAGYFDEGSFRERYPAINELLGVLNVDEGLPF